MSISQNISLLLRWYKEANNLSISELANELGIAVSSLQRYLEGTANLRIDTVELLAEKTNIPVMEMVSGHAPEWERAETIVRAAREFSGLPDEKQEKGIQLLIQLVTLFARDT